MSKPVKAIPPVRATLARQKSDFTAEGSPPPGKVSASTPLTAPGTAETGSAVKPAMRATISLKRTSQARYP
jgi:hypothetical protein